MIRIPKVWEAHASEITSENIYWSRRKFLKKLGLVGLGSVVASSIPLLWKIKNASALTKKSERLKPSPEEIATGYNNYYEFGSNGSLISKYAQELNTENWTIKISGLVKRPKSLDLNFLLSQVPREERVYKMRCVETWTVTIPWTGFPLNKLIRILNPLPSARYIVFKSFLDPNVAQGQRERFWETWPYLEGLRMDEAMHDLTFIATGLYGKALTPQNGSPLRLVVPWKYGFKSIKAIKEIKFTKKQPITFWEGVSPLEYDFWANVDPSRPYARWDQSVENILGEGVQVPSQLFNGYANQVAKLYR